MIKTPSVRFGASLWQLPKAAGQGASAALNFGVQHWKPASLQHQQDGRIHRLSGQTMGTNWSLRLVNSEFQPMEPVQALVQQVLDAVIAQMSNWEEDSVITQFNRSNAAHVIELPAELAHVLEAALHWAQLSGAAIDPSMGALVSLWGFGPRQNPLAAHDGHKPADEQIAALMKVSGYRHLRWSAETRQLMQPGGLALDLCGIAKGFAVDWVVQRLQQAGWGSGLFEIGGELRSWGLRPDDRPWQVQLGSTEVGDADPLVVTVQDGSFASSGDYWHQFSVDGCRYSHTLDPRTGWPVAHDLASVTVFHEECMHADALATVLTVLGPQQGLDFARQHDIAAVLRTHVAADGTSRQTLKTPAWTKRFEA